MSSADFDALALPPAAVEAGATEVLRAAIVDGGLQVSLRPAFEDPDVWGILLADVARHASRMFAAEGKGREKAALRAIRDMFNAELERPTDLGTTHKVS